MFLEMAFRAEKFLGSRETHMHQGLFIEFFPVSSCPVQVLSISLRGKEIGASCCFQMRKTRKQKKGTKTNLSLLTSLSLLDPGPLSFCTVHRSEGSGVANDSLSCLHV